MELLGCGRLKKSYSGGPNPLPTDCESDQALSMECDVECDDVISQPHGQPPRPSRHDELTDEFLSPSAATESLDFGLAITTQGGRP
jgi:hypothetical protein